MNPEALITVRYWLPGNRTPQVAAASRLNDYGLFLNVNSPPPPGTRLRMEVSEEGGTFLTEGKVCDRALVNGDIGMSVRFLAAREQPPPPRGEYETTDLGGRWFYPVRMRTIKDFLHRVHSSADCCGLFVPTDYPAPIGQQVMLQIYPPALGAAPIMVPAEVVERVEVAPGLHPTVDHIAGMEVELVEPESLLRLLGGVLTESA